MIKAEVVFDGALVRVGEFVILCDRGIQHVYIEMERQASFWNLEHAIAYCMESKNA